jgi:maleylacetoacetate isomerase
MTPEGTEVFHLYTNCRSSCSTRVRTVAHIKKIPLVYHYISFVNGEQKTIDYGGINPNYTVPTLIVECGDKPKIVITQSIAIMEFLEERFPDSHPLLPKHSDLAARAHVRQLVSLVACDIQPPTNLRVLQLVREFGGNSENWAKKITRDGLLTFEALAAERAGIYCYGDNLTLADIVLAPAVVNALRFGVDLNEMPTVKRVSETLKDVEAFRLGDWRHQNDTPEEFREM